MKPNPDNLTLAVVIPTHNRWEELRTTLTYLSKSDYAPFDIIVVDDGCTDGTSENCKREFPNVHLLHGDGDLWWSGAINEGTRYALDHGARAIVWMNDDNRIEVDALSQMVASFNRNGARSVICSRTKSLETGTDEWIGEPPIWHRESATWTAPDLSAVDVPISHPPGGRGVLISAECFDEIGLIDAKSFPHYWADHDFHYRAMKAGFRYFLATGAVVWNVPNKKRLTDDKLFSSTGIFWFLFNRRSPMNMPTVRRLLKRHLAPAEYRKIFFPLLRRHLIWLSYEWLKRNWLFEPVRRIKRSLLPHKASSNSSR